MDEDNQPPLILQEGDHPNLPQTMANVNSIAMEAMEPMDIWPPAASLVENQKRQLHPFPTYLTFSVEKLLKVSV